MNPQIDTNLENMRPMFSVEEIREIIGEKKRFLFVYAKRTEKQVWDKNEGILLYSKIIRNRWIVIDTWRPYFSMDGKTKKTALNKLIKRFGK